MARLLATAVMAGALMLLSTLPTASADVLSGRSNGNASFGERLYGGVNFAVGAARHSELDFFPGFASIDAGAWIRRGIGIEAFYDSGLFEGEDGNFEFEIETASGVATRFQSPARQGFFGYVVLGVVAVRIVQDEEDDRGSRTVVQNYQGGRISVGLGQQLSFARNLVVTAEYRNYFVVAELQLDSLALGLRLSFR